MDNEKNVPPSEPKLDPQNPIVPKPPPNEKPLVPPCGKCGRPLTQCACQHNILQK